MANYFDEMARELGLEDLAPSDFHEKLAPIRGLCHGPTGSTRGGRIVSDLKRLTPEEHAERAERAEAFLKQPSIRYPADEQENAH